ncbi:MAG: YfhO family protein, partial [Gemmatimonadaceae bacterium]
AGPVLDAAGSTVYAYKLTPSNEAAWIAPLMVKAPEQQALATVLDPRFDPARIAIIDTSATQVQASTTQALPPAVTTKVAVSMPLPGAYDITLDQPAAAGQALVVSENYFPGWQATADGKPAAVARTDYNLIGIALPAGARTIQLRFQDAAYVKGKRLTLVAILLGVVLLAAGIIADRRRSVSLSTIA